MSTNFKYHTLDLMDYNFELITNLFVFKCTANFHYRSSFPILILCYML